MNRFLALLMGAGLLALTTTAHAQSTQLTDTSSGKCWTAAALSTTGAGITLTSCNGSSNQAFGMSAGNIVESSIPWGYCLREDTLAIDVCWNGYQEQWSITNGYVMATDYPGKALLPDSNGNPTLAVPPTVTTTPPGTWANDQQPAPPPPPPAQGALLLGVQAPQNEVWHAAQPAPSGGVQGQVWLPGPQGEGELVWTTPPDFQYWETALGLPAGTLASSGNGIATCCGWTSGGYEGSDWSVLVDQYVTQQTTTQPRPFWLNIPPYPNDVGATLAQAGTGAFDAHYKAVAQQLVGGGYTNVVFRPIWEFEGSWYAWGWQAVGQPASYCTDYIAAFRDMVAAIRTVMPHAQFAFNAADGTIMPNWQACYPGDDVVDYVAIDTYDGNRSNTQPASARWQNDQVPGITSSQALALAHKKGWAVPEFAIGKMGDNPLFIQNMVAAARAYTANGYPAFLGYWNNGDPNSGYNGYMDGSPDPAVNPLSWAAFIAAAPAGAHK